MPDLRREVRWVNKEGGEREFWLRLRTEKGEIFTKAQLDCRMYKGQDQVREDVEVVDGEASSRSCSQSVKAPSGAVGAASPKRRGREPTCGRAASMRACRR